MKKIAIGSMMALSLYSALVYADQVINDDLIVTFSTCTGNDCVNGESFGFDTLRLKENNLRIHFQDTSNSASFPTNDWRIVANDSSNGGANYLAIEDSTAGRIPFRVEAAAPANSLVVEADGDVGIGTLDPVVNIHNVEGNTPTLRLEQDGSSGFTPQTWDLAGNEANFFIRDVTNGSKLPFKIKPGAPTGSLFIAADGDIGLGSESPAGKLHIENTGGNDTDDFVVLADGKVGIGTTSPSVMFHVVGNSTIESELFSDGLIEFKPTNGGIEISSGDDSTSFIDFKDSAAVDTDGRILYDSSSDRMFFNTGGSTNFTINSDGSVLADSYDTPSDYRLKENVMKAQNSLEKINSVSIYKYDYSNGGEKEVYGVMAHELQKVIPHAVRGSKDNVDALGNPIYQSVDYSKLVPILVNSVQELTKEVKRLEKKVESLERKAKTGRLQ